MVEPSPAVTAYNEAAAQYQLARKHAEALGHDVASLSAKVWVEELDKRFPDVTFAERDTPIIEVGFGTDPSAIVALVEQLKQKGLKLEHVEKDPYGLRLCCSKIQEGDLSAPRTTIVGG